MKKTSIILMVFALALGLTQCKKSEQPTTDNTGNTFNITLSVGGNENSKLVVNPNAGTVVFESGDVIYVGSGGKYVGFLTHDGNHHFAGNITNPVEGQPLQFYFLGNMTPEETISAGATEELSVIISDQTEHLPVISCAPSNEEFSFTNQTYTAHLLNKCALAKFNVTTPSNGLVFMTGFNNKVTVDFSTNTLTSSQEGNGLIALPSGNGEHWAILLPQDAMQEGEAKSLYSGIYSGVRPAIPAVFENGYLAEGIDLSVEVISGPFGAINSKFTVSYGKQVYFSQGNLQYIGSATPAYWKFADNQWDCFGNTTGQGSDSETVDRDLFAWGTSGYSHGAICYQPWSTSTTNNHYFAYGNQSNNLENQTGKADWGYNAIANGGNWENSGWRTLTNSEWGYLFNSRVDASSKWGYGKVDDVNGMIILPDQWALPAGLSFTSGNTATNVYTLDQWYQMEANGAVFLPAAGIRNEISVGSIGNSAHYWASSCYNIEHAHYCYIDVENHTLIPQGWWYRFIGYAVRLVRNV